ncbi:MAG: protein kinase [Planctomycetes bacterium]|nr:protein kinase [Planctomycetota bacterium]
MDKKPKRRLMGVEPERLNQILQPGGPDEEIPDAAASSESASHPQGSSPAGQAGKSSQPIQPGQPVQPGPTESLRPELGLAFEQAGQSIGRYKLLEKIGEGGFGVVYLAQQRTPVTRRVALKIIKPGMDSKQVIGRFEAERQALAMMDHPNIAKVFDAGATDSGRPYFVMELVKGISITQYCDQEKLSTRQRLDLFIPICHAIQHAHQKGIIHRDLKPSNILVALHDGVPVPKVIDFGIAKATQQELTDKTVYTHFQEFIGTPAYMSPEQAEMSGLDIDTRSDIYSLGILLYELLTGRTPFDPDALKKAGLDAMRKVIREQAPQRPSTKLATLEAEELSTTAARHATEPPKLISQLRGDLDWIVLKCLEKDRARRYETANALAMDLTRHHHNEPVVARPPSTTYRIQKAIQRNKLAFAAAGAVAAALVIGFIMSIWGATVATRARDLADTAREEAVQARVDERRLNFRMAFDRGLTLCDQGHVGRGMLWLARALELAPTDESAMERVIRANLNAWRRELHTLEAIFQHDLGVATAVFSSDGQMVLTGCADATVHLWDRQTGKRIGGPLQHTKGEVHEVGFSPDGSYFLTAGTDTTARLWETKSMRLVRIFEHESSVYGALVTPAGQIITSTGKGRVRIWDVDQDTAVDELPQHTTHMVHDITLSPDGKRLLWACHDNVALLWDLETHQLIARFSHTTRVMTADFVGPNGDRIATGDADGNVYLWEWAEGSNTVIGTKVGKPWRHRGGVHRLRTNGDGSQFLTASFDNESRLLSSQTGQSMGAPFGHQGAVRGVAFCKDGSVLTACDDGAARLWRPAPGSLIRMTMPEDSGSYEAIFTADGRYVLTRGENKKASVRNVSTGQLVGKPFDPNGGVFSFALTRDETKIVTGGANQRVQLWETATGQPFGEAFDHDGTVWAVAFSPDGKRMVSGGNNGTVKLWDVNRGRPIRTVLELGLSARVVAFSPRDPAHIVVGSADKLARIVDVDTGKVLRKFVGHQGMVTVVGFSPDGQNIVTGSYDNTVRVWDVDTGLPVSEPMPHLGPMWYTASFSPDGSSVVTGCDDRTVRIWDVATAKPIGAMRTHEAALRTVAFTQGGHQIVTGTATGAIRFWDADITPLEGDVQRIQLWLQVSTGFELDRDGKIRALEVQIWQQRREQLNELGGPPDL